MAKAEKEKVPYPYTLDMVDSWFQEICCACFSSSGQEYNEAINCHTVAGGPDEDFKRCEGLERSETSRIWGRSTIDIYRKTSEKIQSDLIPPLVKETPPFQASLG